MKTIQRVVPLLRPLSTRAGPSRLPHHVHGSPNFRPSVVPSRALHTSQPNQAYRPPLYPSADSPLGYIEESRTEQFQRATSGARLWLKYCFYSTVIVGFGIVTFFEGSHYYVEHYCLPASYEGEEDEYGWYDELISWTGGLKGGTDSRLGYTARHAIRAAWMSEEWGDGGRVKTMPEQGLFEPDFMLLHRLKLSDSTDITTDIGYIQADQYFTTALDKAKSKGMRFPPELSVSRPPGPPSADETANAANEGDSAVVDLLLLKARNYEKIAGQRSLLSAREIYERVLRSTVADGSDKVEARILRLAKKVGDLSERIGSNQEAIEWWTWGLNQVGVDINALTTKKSRWFSRADGKISLDPQRISPALHRAVISLLTSASSHLASHASLEQARRLQDTTLSILQPSYPLPAPTPETAAATLHATWLQHRSTVLTLYLASVAHAQKQQKKSLQLAEDANVKADIVLSVIEPIPRPYASSSRSGLYEPSRQLHRDALLTAAETSFVRGRFLESKWTPPLDTIADCFARAAELNAKESGMTEESAMGKEWHKYWRNYVRIKSKLGEEVESPFKTISVDYTVPENKIERILADGYWRFVDGCSRMGLHLAPQHVIRERIEEQKARKAREKAESLSNQ